MIRPECARVELTRADRGSAPEDGVTGNVVKIDFLGPTVQYTVDLGTAVINALRFSNDQELLQLGDPVGVSWKAHDVLFFPEDLA
jgi:hypothetical protein